MLQAHLCSLNNLELCIKAFFRNDNILKPRNADNDVYEKQHQFNASKHSKCVSCSSCILPRGQYSLLTRVSLNINENHKHWNEPESVLLSLSIFIIFIYRNRNQISVLIHNKPDLQLLYIMIRIVIMELVNICSEYNLCWNGCRKKFSFPRDISQVQYVFLFVNKARGKCVFEQIWSFSPFGILPHEV